MTVFELNDRSTYKAVDRRLVAKLRGLAKPSFADTYQRPEHERSRAAASKEHEQPLSTRSGPSHVRTHHREAVVDEAVSHITSITTAWPPSGCHATRSLA